MEADPITQAAANLGVQGALAAFSNISEEEDDRLLDALCDGSGMLPDPRQFELNFQYANTTFNTIATDLRRQMVEEVVAVHNETRELWADLHEAAVSEVKEVSEVFADIVQQLGLGVYRELATIQETVATLQSECADCRASAAAQGGQAVAVATAPPLVYQQLIALGYSPSQAQTIISFAPGGQPMPSNIPLGVPTPPGIPGGPTIPLPTGTPPGAVPPPWQPTPPGQVPLPTGPITTPGFPVPQPNLPVYPGSPNNQEEQEPCDMTGGVNVEGHDWPWDGEYPKALDPKGTPIDTSMPGRQPTELEVLMSPLVERQAIAFAHILPNPSGADCDWLQADVGASYLKVFGELHGYVET